jgi:hypothetical protein
LHHAAIGVFNKIRATQCPVFAVSGVNVGVENLMIHSHKSKFGGAGGGGFILGIAIVWWVQPKTSAGAVVLVVLTMIIVIILFYLASWFPRGYRRL